MKLRRWLGLGAAAGGAALGYALLEARWYTLRRVAVAVLPAGAAPLRLLHISDLHLTAGQRRKVEWVRGLADLAPDLVVATGDNYSSADAMEVALEALEPLLAFPGAFVLGSHDHYSAVFKNPLTYLAGRKHARQSLARTPDLPAEAFAGVLQRAGWHRLDNARASLRLGPAGMATDLVGLAVPH
ncbi:MAG: metallophosphoesterase, partial [Bifidobacteriaceae bacterium]|nr:metallophosphoesterase [Bifidobacteriaceae bacterium]